MKSSPFERVPSRTSWAWLAGGLSFACATLLVLVRAPGGDVTRIWAGADLLTSAAVATVILRVAHQSHAMAPRSSWRWALMGAAAVCAVLGAAAWLYNDLVAAAPSAPDLADVLYFLQGPLIATALITTGVSYRNMVSLRRPAIIAVAVAAVSGAFLWIAVLEPLFTTPGAMSSAAFAALLYPLADVVFGVGPAVFVLAVDRRLSKGPHQWPWMSVSLGILLLTGCDLVYAVMTANGVMGAGSIVGAGWITARVLVGFGALLASDLIRAARA